MDSAAESVDPHQIPQTEGRSSFGQSDDIPRRFVGEPGEGLHLPARAEDRVVLEGLEEAEPVVDPAEQGLEVVVLAEEGVEAALHLEGLAGREPVGPGPGAAAEKGLAFGENDRNAALGEDHRRRHPGEAAAGDHRRLRRTDLFVCAAVAAG